MQLTCGHVLPQASLHQRSLPWSGVVVTVLYYTYLYEARFITVQIDVVPAITTCRVDLDLLKTL